MADVSLKLFEYPTITAAGVLASNAQKTNGFTDITFALAVKPLSGAGGDTLNIVIQESDDQDFTDASRVRDVLAFTQVLGNSTGTVLKQRPDLPTKNIDIWCRAVITTVGAPATFSQKVLVSILATNKI